MAKKITVINKTTANQLSTAVVAELVAFRFKGGVMGASLVMKIEAAIVNEDGSAETEFAAAFKRYVDEHGIPLEALGKKFPHGNKQFILRGYNPSAPKFPWVAENVATGEMHRLTKGGVERTFGPDAVATKGAKKPAPGGKVPKADAPMVGFKKGQSVMARWEDGQMYKAKYLKPGIRVGYHRVLFEDGTEFGTKTLKLA